MNQADIQKLIKQALENLEEEEKENPIFTEKDNSHNLYKKQKYDRKLHEICINHRLSNCIEKNLLKNTVAQFFCDLEFNREGSNLKEIDNKSYRPDIIVHNRKSNSEKENILIVECKKEGASPEEIDKDKEKIKKFIKDISYKYQYGLQVLYQKNGSVKGTLFYKCKTGSIEEIEL